MPIKCCIPNCRGNYDKDGPKVSIFAFPRDEETRALWLKRIPLHDYSPTKYSRVCQLHFDPGDLELESSTWDSKTGELLLCPLKHPRLKKGALPCIFPGFPKLTKKFKKSTRRVTPEQKKKEKEMAELRLKRVKEEEEKRQIAEREKLSSLDDLESKMIDFLSQENLRSERLGEKLYFYKLSAEPELRVKFSVELDENLTTEVFLGRVKMPSIKLNNAKLVFPYSNPTLSIVQAILKKMNKTAAESVVTTLPEADARKEMVLLIKDMLSSFSSESNKDHLHFLFHQIDCLGKSISTYRWSSEIITFLGFFMALFPRAYYFLMRSQRLILPSPGLVKELSSERFTYIPKVKKHAKGEDNYVVIVLNEIDVRPFSGVFKKKGYSTACVYVFSVSSLNSPFKEVIYVTPVQTDYTPSKLHGTLLKLIAEVEKAGFKVVGLVSDNLPFNVDAISRLANPPKLSIAYVHPCDVSRPLFYIIDPGHTFKCIRDDWLRTPEGIMRFPNFHCPTGEDLLSAKFSDVKRLLEPPTNQCLTYTHSISKMAINPVFPHRRDLKLVLEVFSYAVVNDLSALSQMESNEVSETAQFINILTNWWKVVSFDSLEEPCEGLANPLTLESESFKYLETLLEWIEIWGEIIEMERSKVRADLEAQLADKQARQAEKAAKAALAELSGARKRKRKRPKKTLDTDVESGPSNEAELQRATEFINQENAVPPERVINETDTYQPNGNVSWVEHNLNAICGRMNPAFGQAYGPINGYPECMQSVYSYNQPENNPFGPSQDHGYEFHLTPSGYYQHPGSNQLYQSSDQGYGSSGSHPHNLPHRGSENQPCERIVNLDDQPVVVVMVGSECHSQAKPQPSKSVVTGEGDQQARGKTQPPGLLPIMKQKHTSTPKRPSEAKTVATAEGNSGSKPAGSTAKPADKSSSPGQNLAVVVPRFQGLPRRGGPRLLRFNFVLFETYTALKHSTYALLEITRYCITELKLKHVLPGKIRVDGLQMICVDSSFTPGGEKED